MKKIKLMVVTPYFYPEAGGVANHTYNLYKRIANRNTEVIVVTSGKEKEIIKEEISEIKVYRLPISFKVSNTPINFKWKKQIDKLIKIENPNIIMGHMPVPYICDITLPIAKKKNIPFVIKYHVSGSMKKGSFFIDLLIRLYESIFLKKLFKYSDRILVSSKISEIFLSNYSEKTSTITPGVDIKKFKPKITNKKNHVLFVANLKKSEDYKGLKYLLDAIKLVKKQIPSIKLIVVGDGDAKEDYIKQSNELGIEKNIKFVGRLPREETIKKFQETNIFVLPSSFESFGMVLIEAMACKKPVIGSNIGGIPDVIDDKKNGVLIPTKDPKALAKAITKILRSSKLSKRMGDNGYKKAKAKFTWESKVKETMRVIEDVLK